MCPTARHKKALQAIADLEAGKSTFLNHADAEECEQNGWAEALPEGRWRLTDEGRRILRATG